MTGCEILILIEQGLKINSIERKEKKNFLNDLVEDLVLVRAYLSLSLSFSPLRKLLF